MTYRLIPWLNCELNILIDDPEIRLSDVMEKILGLLTKHPIRSRPFKAAIKSYFWSIQKTNHFLHEFLNFAHSPNNNAEFDDNAVYVTKNVLPLPLPIKSKGTS
jgi:E3 ubiquitin-protein ligase Topors